MSAETPIHMLSASTALQKLKSNTLSVQGYAENLIKRIRERDQIIRAWAHLDYELIRRQARALDQLPYYQRGPLFGLAIGIKDVIQTKDMPTQYGSPLYHNYHSNVDASIVSLLRSAGALIFGKTTTTQFTVENSGPTTTNPHDIYRTPGGSSAGSAAAVADFQVPLSVGTQTGGSVIRPASYTGVYAFKPTYNVVSMEGVKTVAPTLDTLGFFARSVEDLQLLIGVLGITNDAPLRDLHLHGSLTAIVVPPMGHFAGPSTIAAMDKASEVLRNAGAKVKKVKFPDEISDCKVLEQMQKVIIDSEVNVSLLNEYRKGLTMGNQEDRIHPNCELLKASDTFARIRPLFDEIAARYDLIITPSAVDEAPIGVDMGSAVFNTPWTMLHMPVLNIPAFKGGNGMPVGVSVIGGRFYDNQLLRTGAVLNAALMGERDGCGEGR